jgi:hypothetical protein
MADTTTPTWRLVPEVPTPEMLANAMKECGSIGAGSCGEHTGVDWDDMRSVYEAMLAASPAPQELPPVQLPEPVATVESAGQGGAYTSAYVRWHGLAPVGTKLYTADQLRAAIAADRRAGGR